jgi:hypothetical protein
VLAYASQTGLFSASVAVLLAVSIGDLRPSSQDTSAFYLQNIYELLSDPNRSNPIIPSALSIPPAFSPPKYAVWVNSLWFLSLVTSLTCGLQATLLQQWARRYINITQASPRAHNRARIRAFFANGVETLHLPWVIEALPTLLHLSLFLFFAGLVIYLFNINHTVFAVVTWWVGFCTATYVGVTLMPLFRHDSPYYAPLSSSAWYLVNGVLYVTVKSLHWLVWHLVGHGEICDRLNIHGWQYRLEDRFYRGITRTAEEAAERQSPEADHLAVKRVLELSDEDLHLEEFFALIPGFFKSKVMEDSQHIFNDGLVSGAMLEWMNRTLSSNTLSDEVKQRRIAICRKVMDITSLPVNYSPLDIGLYNWDEFFCSIDSALILKAATYHNSDALYNSKCAISVVLARVQKRDDIWRKLATDHLGVSESVLQDYLAHGDSATLANLNSFIRRAISIYSMKKCFPDYVTKTLKWISKLDVQGTLPELRHDFCTLWNELVMRSRAQSNFYGPNEILTGVRHIYIALHQSTASTLPAAFSAPTAQEARDSLEPPSYPQCTVTDHHSGSASHVHRDVVDTKDLPARTFPTMVGSGEILGFDTPTDIDALSSPTPSPYHANLSPLNKPSLYDIPAASQRSNTSILTPAQMSPVNDEGHHSPINPFESTTTLVIRNSIYTDTTGHTANSSSRTSLLRTTSTPTFLHSSISRSNRTAPPQQDEESTAFPLSTFSYPPSPSIPSFTSNAPPASAFSSLPASAGDHIPTILVFVFPLTLNRHFLTHTFVGHFYFGL